MAPAPPRLPRALQSKPRAGQRSVIPGCWPGSRSSRAPWQRATPSGLPRRASVERPPRPLGDSRPDQSDHPQPRRGRRPALLLDRAAIRERLDRVIGEHRQRDRLAAFRLHPRHKLLLLGPPGSGKTTTAHALVGEMWLPMFTVRLDGLITRYLGETAAKLRHRLRCHRAQPRGVSLHSLRCLTVKLHAA